MTASMVRTRWQKLTSPLFETADLYGQRGGRQWRMELDRGDTMAVEKWRRRGFATESGPSIQSIPPVTKISVSLRLFENEGRSGRHRFKKRPIRLKKWPIRLKGRIAGGSLNMLKTLPGEGLRQVYDPPLRIL